MISVDLHSKLLLTIRNRCPLALQDFYLKRIECWTQWVLQFYLKKLTWLVCFDKTSHFFANNIFYHLNKYLNQQKDVTVQIFKSSQTLQLNNETKSKTLQWWNGIFISCWKTCTVHAILSCFLFWIWFKHLISTIFFSQTDKWHNKKNARKSTTYVLQKLVDEYFQKKNS